MEVMQKINDGFTAIKVYLGSAATIAGGAWSWMGNNYQSIGAALGILAFIYTTIVFFQGQIDRRRRLKK